MKLFGANGTTFKLTLLGYEFPEMISEPYDSNWLIIEVDVATPQRLWRASDPSLLTYEVERLAHWLEQIANGIPDDQTCGFIEPCLAFELHDHETGKRTLRIKFDLELRPDWPVKRIWQREDIWIDMQADSSQLIRATQDLRKQLQRYPQRAEQ